MLAKKQTGSDLRFLVLHIGWWWWWWWGGVPLTDELIHHTQQSADSCHCHSSSLISQLHPCGCWCAHSKRNNNSAWAKWQDLQIQCFFYLQINTYDVQMQTLTRGDKSPHSFFHQPSGPMSEIKLEEDVLALTNGVHT